MNHSEGRRDVGRRDVSASGSGYDGTFNVGVRV